MYIEVVGFHLTHGAFSYNKRSSLSLANGGCDSNMAPLRRTSRQNIDHDSNQDEVTAIAKGGGTVHVVGLRRTGHQKFYHDFNENEVTTWARIGDTRSRQKWLD